MQKEKKYKAEILIISFFLCFTFFVFGPIQLYITNRSEFWFCFSDVALPSVLFGIIAFFIFVFIGLIIPNKWAGSYAYLLEGMALALYIQGNFIQTDYGLMDGRTIQWSEYKDVEIWNTVFWIICIIAPFVVKSFLKEKEKFLSFIVPCFLILVEAITIFVLMLSLSFSERPRDEMYLSNRNLYTVSKNKNVVIFILDCFDQGSYLENIIAEDPQILDPLDGFTYYKNTTCAYPRTDASLPYLLTGQYYKNEKPYGDYIADSYQQTDYYKDLKEEGFDIGIYTYDKYVSDAAKSDFINNAEMGNIRVSSYVDLERAMLKFTAFCYFPHIAKKHVWFYSGMFDQFKKEDEIAVPAFPTGDNNLNFYNGLKEEGLSLTNNGHAYRFIHLSGTHFPYTLNSDITVADEGQATVMTQGKAALNIVYEYLKQLKELGVYDNTMIIITADHGWDSGYHTKSPIFFVKGFGKRGPYIPSNAPISHANLQATVMKELGLNDKERYGKSVYDILEDSIAHRPYFWFAWDGTGGGSYLPNMTEYIIDEKKHFHRTGKMYTSEGEETYSSYKITLEENHYFSNEGGGTSYFIEGISYIEWDGAWSLGQVGRMILEVGDQSSPLNFSFQLSRVYHSPQKLIVKSNGKVLYDRDVFSADDSINFTIPSDCVTNGFVVLDLEYPDAISPLSLGESKDSRNIAFKFSSFQVHVSGMA